MQEGLRDILGGDFAAEQVAAHVFGLGDAARPGSLLDEVIAKKATFPEAMAAGKITFSGNPMKLGELMALMDEFPRMFEIVEPKRAVVS